MILVIQLEITLGVAALVAFVALFGLRSQWRINRVGPRLLAFMAVTMGLIISLALLAWGIVLPLPVWLIGFGLFDYATVALLVQLIRTQRKERKGS